MTVYVCKCVFPLVRLMVVSLKRNDSSGWVCSGRVEGRLKEKIEREK